MVKSLDLQQEHRWKRLDLSQKYNNISGKTSLLCCVPFKKKGSSLSEVFFWPIPVNVRGPV